MRHLLLLTRFWVAGQSGNNACTRYELTKWYTHRSQLTDFFSLTHTLSLSLCCTSQLPSVAQDVQPLRHVDEEDAAAALAETHLPAIPGGHPSDFERVWAESSFDRYPQPIPQSSQAVMAVLHSFLRPDNDGEGMNRFLGPQPGPRSALSVPEGLRVRNRSTILARHVYAHKGPMYADQQVEALLQALHIDPQSLPEILPDDSKDESWNRIYDQSSFPHSQRFTAENFNALEPSWAEEYAATSSRAHGEGWIDDYIANGAGTGTADLSKIEPDSEARLIQVGTQEHSKKLADTLNKDPKFQNSKFLQFVSKMSNGELIVEGNTVKQVKQVKEASISNPPSAWVEEFSDSKPSMWGEEFASFQAQQHPSVASSWVDEFVSTNFDPTLQANQSLDWGNEYLEQLERAEILRNENRLTSDYVFAENNPFLMDNESLEKGKDLFQRGVLTEAVLAFEAACQQTPGSAEAWRLLGTVHAENDDDVKAIVALNRSLAIAPDEPSTLLSLGVSHTNELEREPAVRYLKQWILSHPTHGPLLSDSGLTDMSADSSQSLNSVVRLFEAATAHAPSEPEVHSALGVLYTLSRRFSDAVAAFEAALEIRGNVDYSLWNKLGATLANSGRSSEALAAYQRALDLKPNYMRAWTNMGIALANLGDYDNSARYYVRALALNRTAPSVWGYLRNSLSCAGREDLMRAADEEDLDALLVELPL